MHAWDVSGPELELHLAGKQLERGQTFARVVRHGLRALADAAARRRRWRAALRELRALDDRMLADIGLRRSDIALLATRAGRSTPPPPAPRPAMAVAVAPTAPPSPANDNAPAAAAARRPSCA